MPVCTSTDLEMLEGMYTLILGCRHEFDITLTVINITIFGRV
jgi:hypothetical protein